MLAERGGPLGYVLWRVVGDVLLWNSTAAEGRGGLFAGQEDPSGEVLALAVREAPELQEAIHTLWVVQKAPELADPERLAEACGTVVAWAEALEMKEIAVQFAELAARIQPHSAARAFTAGRLLRRKGEFHRAGIWYWRSARLARRANSNIDRANAHLGLGNLEHDLGHFATAERHYWKAARAALRNGRKSLAASAFHNLVGVTYEAGRPEEALDHLRAAAGQYHPEHPRFPVLVYDAGFYLLREGYFFCALLVFGKVLPWVEGERVSILVRSAYARAAAAVRDPVRYRRASDAVLAMVEVDREGAANALYQLAEGARSLSDWERARALAVRSLQLATSTDGATVPLAESLLAAIDGRIPGDVDRVPAEGDPVEQVTQELVRKLDVRRRSSVGPSIPPERYPLRLRCVR